jgi:hypothetical protein
VLAEQRVVLEQKPVPGIRIEDELGVGQALRQAYRVHRRDDEIIAPARHQHWVRHFAQPGVGRVLTPCPLS